MHSTGLNKVHVPKTLQQIIEVVDISQRTVNNYMISGSQGSIAENMANIIFQSCTTIIQTKPYSTTNELIIQVNETDLRNAFCLRLKMPQDHLVGLT